MSQPVDTRSGELLSATIGMVVSLSLLLQRDSPMYKVLDDVGALPEWALVSILCNALAYLAVFVNSIRLQAIARFWSGCLWGSIILIYAVKQEMAAVFWCAVVLFAFDIILVVHKGKIWTRRSRC